MFTRMRVQLAKCMAFRPDIIMEIGSRVVIIIIFVITDYAVPFKRTIQPEEVWLYRFPRSEDFIPFKTLQVFIITFSAMVIWAVYQSNKSKEDAVSALLGLSLAMYLSATITNFIKLVVGRPRPDFIERCFKDPPNDIKELAQALCDGDEETINQGYKSFPSGHATMALSGMFYISLYISHSLKTFSQRHSRYSGPRLCCSIAPFVLGVLIAASRTADYHHHWQDVMVGSMIGITVAYMCFCQNFQGLQIKSRNISKIESSPKSPAEFVGVQTF